MHEAHAPSGSTLTLRAQRRGRHAVWQSMIAPYLHFARDLEQHVQRRSVLFKRQRRVRQTCSMLARPLLPVAMFLHLGDLPNVCSARPGTHRCKRFARQAAVWLAGEHNAFRRLARQGSRCRCCSAPGEVAGLLMFSWWVSNRQHVARSARNHTMSFAAPG